MSLESWLEKMAVRILGNEMEKRGVPAAEVKELVRELAPAKKRSPPRRSRRRRRAAEAKSQGETIVARVVSSSEEISPLEAPGEATPSAARKDDGR